MKKIIVVFVFLFVTIISQAQFFKPVPKDLFKTEKLAAIENPSVWLFRPVVELTALQFTFAKPVEVNSLSSLGTGISYQHFIEVDGEPYNNFGVNGLVLFSQNLGGIEPARLSIAVTVSTLQFVNIGIGYNLGLKQAFVLTGITYNFN